MSPALSPEHALPMINRLLINALLALARAGDAEQACRLAGQGYSTLRRCHPSEAARLDALLHGLTRRSATDSSTQQGVTHDRS